MSIWPLVAHPILTVRAIWFLRKASRGEITAEEAVRRMVGIKEERA